MKLSTVILLAGAGALPLMLAAQFRWLSRPPAEFRRKRTRLLWAAALLFPLLALAHCKAVERERPPQPRNWTTTFPGGSDMPERGPSPPPPPPR